MKCPVCGYGLYDENLALSAATSRHLQLCGLAVQKRLAVALEEIRETGLLMRMEGRVPESAPERFQNGGE